MWLAIASILGTLIPTILANRGVIGAQTDNLIVSLEGPILGLFTNLRSADTGIGKGLAILAAASGAIAVLKANTSLPADALQQIDNVDKDITAALSGYVTAGKGYDESLYPVIANV